MDTTSSTDDSVWVCFICAHAFQKQDELMLHQDACEKDFDEREQLKEMISTAKPPARFRHRPRSRLFSLTRTKRKPVQEIYIPPAPDLFFNSIGLLPTQKAEKIRMTPKKNDEDCQIIGVENFTEPVPTPRTPKSLMSQLSREGEASARRRHLSFSNVQTPDSDSENSGSGNDNVEKETSKLSKASIALFGIPLSSTLGRRVRKSLKTDNSVPVISNYEKYCFTGAKSDFMDKLRNRPSDFPVTFYKKKRFIARFVHQYKFSRAHKVEFRKIVKTGLDKRSRCLLTHIRRCSIELTRLSKEVIKEWTRPKPKPVIQWRYMQPGGLNPRKPVLLPRPQMRQFSPQMRYSVPLMRQRAPLPRLAPQPMFMYRNASGQLLTGVGGPPIRVQRFPVLGQTLQRIVRPMNVSAAPFRPPILRQPESVIPSQLRPQYLVRTAINSRNAGGGASEDVFVINLDDDNPSEAPSPQKSANQSPEVRRADSPSSKRKQTFSNLREDDEIIISMSSSSDEESGSKVKQGCCLNCDKKIAGACLKNSPNVASTSAGVGRGGGASRGGRLGPGGKPRKFRSAARAAEIKNREILGGDVETTGAKSSPQNKNGLVYSSNTDSKFGNIVPGTKVIASTVSKSQVKSAEVGQSSSPGLAPQNSALPIKISNVMSLGGPGNGAQRTRESIARNVPGSSGTSELAKHLAVPAEMAMPVSQQTTTNQTRVTPVGSTVFKQCVANQLVEVICIDDSDED